MDWKKRLLRRPAWNALWLVVLLAMALLAGVGGALALSSLRLPAALDGHMTTVAVQTQNGESSPAPYGNGLSWRLTPVALMEEDIQALGALPMVELVDLRTLTGAYIPQLTAQIGLKDYWDMNALNALQFANDSYNQVILAGTVEESWLYPLDYDPWYDISELGGSDRVKTAYAYAIMNVEDILVANRAYDFFATEKYRSYDGKVYIRAMIYDETGENPFTPGRRYIVSGSYDPSVHGYEFTPYGVFHPWVELDDRYGFAGSYCFVEDGKVWQYRHTEEDYSFYGAVTDNVITYTEGTDPVVVAEAFEGTVEEFLASRAGHVDVTFGKPNPTGKREAPNTDWQAEIDTFTMAQHTFPVLGTECLETMQYFVANTATVTQGRTFTQEEYDTGAKVCVISESLALSGGIAAGDTIALTQYLCAADTRENTSLYDDANSYLNNPTLGYIPYYDGSGEEETFTVVGIYRLERSWEDSAFAFTPNTVFVPQKAQIPGGFGGCSTVEHEMRTAYLIDPATGKQTGETEQYLAEITHKKGVFGVYLSLKLKNGTMEDFMAALPELGLEEHVFLTFDQGYEAAQESVQAVVNQAWKLLGIAAAGWALLLMLYILLYQAGERRNLGIMRSLGAQPPHLRRYLFVSGLLPALVGIPLGTALSGTAVGLVQERLVGISVDAAVSGPMAELVQNTLAGSMPSPWALLGLAAMELAVLCAILWLHAAVLSKKQARKLLGV